MQKIMKLLLAVLVIFLGTTAGAAHADALNRSTTKSGLTVHFGVVPADKAMVVERGASAPEDTQTHGGSSYHLVVALFDKSTGARIDDATVTAKVTSPAHKSRAQPQVKLLQALRINDTVTYGNYFEMPWQGRYRIDLSVTRKGNAEPTHIRLAYDQHF
ncbi:hypothetical protein PWR63_35140 [Paraburkholderia sp. A2WS-5]|uniref:hypothetical protein n=1 Tax=unclassified Paraburkholderia TaxID=2615204 RepID=UPI003B7A93A9